MLNALCTTMHRPVEDVMPPADDDGDGLEDDGELLEEEELSGEED